MPGVFLCPGLSSAARPSGDQLLFQIGVVARAVVDCVGSMAKWGEGDPRWIVEERPDATNVNNWHWTEKNADAWSKAKIKVGWLVTQIDCVSSC